MRKATIFIKLFSTIILFLLITSACSEKEKSEPPESKYPIVDTTRPLSEEEKALVRGVNQFGFNLFSKMATSSEFRNKNLVISPFSISMALGMALMGAREDTYNQMADVLGFSGMTTESVGENYRSLFLILENLDKTIKFDISNSVWLRKGFDPYESYINSCKNYFFAEIFPNEPFDSLTVKKVNNWVSKATRGKIDHVVDSLDDSVVSLLVNAIYFLGNWTHKFNPENTKPAPFTNINGEKKTVEMMENDEDFKYFKGENFQMVSLPYGNEKFYMTIILPDTDVNIYEFVTSEVSRAFEKWKNEKTKELEVFLPKFELHSDLMELKGFLRQLGMKDPFDESKADFSGMAPISLLSRLYLSSVLHKTYIKVDEKGTEAAAVTVVGVEATAYIPPPIFKVDHPFIFIIHDVKTKSILFMGVIVDLGS